MSIIKRKWDILPKEKREVIIREIITYFETKRGEQVGVLAADDILDFFLELFGRDVHNKTIEDVKSVVKQNFENLEVDLDLLINK